MKSHNSLASEALTVTD